VSSYSMPLLMVAWSLCIGGAFAVVQWVRVRRGVDEGCSFRLRRQGVTKALLLSLSLGYSTLLKTTLSLLHCVHVEGHGDVLLIAGNVTCYTPWQLGLFVLTGGLFLFPLFLALWLHRRVHSSSFVGSAAEALVKPFRPNRHFWPAVVFSERLVLVVLFSFTPVQARPWALFFTLIALTAIHLIVWPFVDPKLNVLDVSLLGILAAIAALSTTSTLYLIEGIDNSEKKLIPYAAMAMVLKLAPFCLIACLMLCSVLKRRQPTSPVTLGGDDIVNRDDGVELGVFPPLTFELDPPMTLEEQEDTDAILC